MAATSVTGAGNGAALQNVMRHKLDMGGNNLNMSGGVIHQLALSYENITGGAAAAVSLSVNTVVSFCTTATSKAHVVLPDGHTIGQVKYVVFKTEGNSVDLVLTPDTFGAGATVTFHIAGNGIHLIWDGTSWDLLSMDEATNANSVA